jgi:GTP-binding protein
MIRHIHLRRCTTAIANQHSTNMDSRRTGQIIDRLTKTNVESFPLFERDFVDRRQIVFRSGKGGDPAPNTVRGQTKNGPAFGGHGGSILLRGSSALESLSQLPVDHIISADAGGDGHQYSRGLHGRDRIIEVPLGTILRERIKTSLTTSEGRRVHTPRFIYQFLKDGDTIKLCEGGKGGIAPLTFKKGDGRKGANGEKKSIDLELRLLSDCALIGAPNAGKTSILSSMTSSLTRIGPEPYSTTRPHLGTLHFRDGVTIKIVDLPGVVEGDSVDKFRGIRVLRHMWRAKFVLYCIDISNNVETDPFDQLELLRNEVHAFDGGKFPRREMIVATKCDMLHKDSLMHLDSLYYRVQARLGPDIPVVGTSARFGLGINRLVQEMRNCLYPTEIDMVKDPVPGEIIKTNELLDT